MPASREVISGSFPSRDPIRRALHECWAEASWCRTQQACDLLPEDLRAHYSACEQACEEAAAALTRYLVLVGERRSILSARTGYEVA